MFKLLLVLLTTRCLCAADTYSSMTPQHQPVKNSSEPNPYRIRCLYEKFNSSVKNLAGAKGVWHLVKAIVIQKATVLQDSTNYAMTFNIRKIEKDFFYVKSFEERSGMCQKVPLFLYPQQRANGGLYLHRAAIAKGRPLRATAYPLFLHPDSTGVVWYRHLSIHPDTNVILVLSRFYNETRLMDRVNATLRAFCPELGPSVEWRDSQPALSDPVANPGKCAISHGWFWRDT